MAFTFIPEDRKQKYLLVFVGVVLLSSIAVLGNRFLPESPPSFFQTQPPPPRVVDIDFSVFQTSAFLELGDAGVRIPFPEGVGRGNPFLPVQ